VGTQFFTEFGRRKIQGQLSGVGDAFALGNVKDNSMIQNDDGTIPLMFVRPSVMDCSLSQCLDVDISDVDTPPITMVRDLLLRLPTLHKRSARHTCNRVACVPRHPSDQIDVNDIHIGVNAVMLEGKGAVELGAFECAHFESDER